MTTKKQKRENEWYRKPKHQMIFEAAFTDKEDKKSTIEIVRVVEDDNFIIDAAYTEKFRKLIDYAESLGLEYHGTHVCRDRIEGVLTKKKQAEKYAMEEFTKAIFHECGAQAYL